MTLMITIFAAVVSTVVWYSSEKARSLNVGMLCYMFWGASIMWMVDAVYEYAELRAEYFTPAVEDMINDAFLGGAVIALALTVWVVVLLIKDPAHVLRKAPLTKEE